MVPGGAMSDQIELYLRQHVDSAVDLYLLVSDLLEYRTAPGYATRSRTGSDEDESAVFLRLRHLLEGIRLGSERCCLYSTPLRASTARS